MYSKFKLLTTNIATIKYRICSLNKKIKLEKQKPFQKTEQNMNVSLHAKNQH